METGDLTPVTGSSFEELKRLNEHGCEYWSARDLQHRLGYTNWRRFEDAVRRAMTSCEKSGNEPRNHFDASVKMVGVGSGAAREVPDHSLSRFACYLIAQNGNPRKPEIALAQKYFAIQTRRQELSDQAAKDMERLELRNQAKEEFKQLSGAARAAGVASRMFGVFHDAGYRGLYGMGREAILKHKNLPPDEQLMDRMDTTELAANQFRMTQTRDKLARERVADQTTAIHTHEEVGREVRRAIQNIGGTMPELIPPAEHIDVVKLRLETDAPKLELDGNAARGLVGERGHGPSNDEG